MAFESEHGKDRVSYRPLTFIQHQSPTPTEVLHTSLTVVGRWRQAQALDSAATASSAASNDEGASSSAASSSDEASRAALSESSAVREASASKRKAIRAHRRSSFLVPEEEDSQSDKARHASRVA